MVRIQGLEQLRQKLKAIGKKSTIKRITRKSARQAMNIARDAARANAKALDDPITKEKIWKNIVTQTGKTSNSNEIRMRVGIRGGAAQNKYTDKTALSGLPGGITTYWHYIEFGTSEIAAQPFMRPALSKNVGQITDKFVQVFSAEINIILGGLS
ncbi:HK97 gp10 family phage protein [Acinetobacter sp. ANC 3789]|uniref:HK97-gp10 family putative phage morphogenesis protein n=1 Tax=Acinetobacter sp. ANC 3789 TaxID=1217714 RepID=UPI0002D0E1FD|nr:HK97-gp10 family putative phage morphogenesis protein [Acinetobacter sp. ANC 3789]ENU80141.1 HK97 gp10 family phage protein [Acinetobacter sp. ANC 3789]